MALKIKLLKKSKRRDEDEEDEKPSKKKSKKDRDEKPAKKGGKKDKPEKASKKKGGDRSAPSAANYVELTPKLEKLVNRAIAAEEGIAEAEQKFQEELETLRDALREASEGKGASSFKHPDKKKGLFSVMERDGKFFWRPKPQGGRAA